MPLCAARDNVRSSGYYAGDYAEYACRNGAIGLIDLFDARRTLRAVELDAAAALREGARALAVRAYVVRRLGDEAACMGGARQR